MAIPDYGFNESMPTIDPGRSIFRPSSGHDAIPVSIPSGPGAPRIESTELGWSSYSDASQNGDNDGE